jgi:hypothetical protein
MLRVSGRFVFWLVTLSLQVFAFLVFAHLDVLKQLWFAALELAIGRGQKGRSCLDRSFLRQARLDLDEFGGCIKL